MQESTTGGETRRETRLPVEIPTGIEVDYKNLTARQIADLISRSQTGKIPFSLYMHECLYGENGFYAKGKVKFTDEVDFVTYPEMSPAFGATVANYLERAWKKMGKPKQFDLVEMGAGSGEMAKSILDWAQISNIDFYNALKYTVVEYGGGLIRRQIGKLNDHKNVKWIKGSAFELPVGQINGAFVSNELPDAFPVELVTKMGERIVQKYISVRDNEWVEIWDEPTEEVKRYIRENDLVITSGLVEPINMYARDFQAQIDQALNRGIVITFDYGELGQVGSENPVRLYGLGIQGELNQRYLYSHPGLVDITFSVNHKTLLLQGERDGMEKEIFGRQDEVLKEMGFDDVVETALIIEESPRSSKKEKDILMRMMISRDYVVSPDTRIKGIVQSKNL